MLQQTSKASSKAVDATIVQHRHLAPWWKRVGLFIIGKKAYIEFQYKIVFSDPSWYKEWNEFVLSRNGVYDYDKARNIQYGIIPEFPEYTDVMADDYCWCDLMAYFLTSEGFSLSFVGQTTETSKFKAYTLK